MSDVTQNFQPPVSSNPYYPDAAFPIGTPVCFSSSPDRVKKAKADALATSLVLGLATRAASAGQSNAVFCKYGQILELTTAQWDAITGGSGGLTPGDPYYLSDATAGMLTTVAPSTSGHYIVLMGIAVSDTEMQVTLGTPTAPSQIIG